MDSSEELDCPECEKSRRYPNEIKTVHIIYLREGRTSNGAAQVNADEHCSLQDTIQLDTVTAALTLKAQEADVECNYKCSECERSFTKFNIFEDHIKSHNPFKCEVCGICFPTESLLDYHTRRHISNFSLHKIDSNKLENDLMLISEEKKKHQCVQCKICFLSEKGLEVHKRSHEKRQIIQMVKNNQITVQSSDSSSAALDKSKFDNQIGDHTNTKQFTCPVCSRAFLAKHYLIRHSLIHAGDSFKCSNCGEEFSENSQLVEHYKTHTIIKPYKCILCDKMYDTLLHMQNHYRSHLVDKPFMCSKCQECFKNEESLNAHLNKHDSGKFFHCTTCSRIFKSVACLKIHYRTHTGEKPYSCPSCDRVFSEISTMRRHIQEIHSDRNPKFPCPLCSKMLSRKSTVRTHIETYHLSNHAKSHKHINFDESMFENVGINKELSRHNSKPRNSFRNCSTKIKSYPCKECGKLFGLKCLLDSHYRTHTGEKPFLCSKCGKQFLDLTSLKIHYRLHTGEKPYECSECGKFFRQSCTYQRHCMRHRNEKPYVCHICGKAFVAKTYLMTHIRYHMGEKRYKCSLCDKAFVERSTLTKHFKTHFQSKCSTVINVQKLLAKKFST